MDYALSTVGQGPTAYITMPATLTNSLNIDWVVGGVFVVPELPTGTGLIHLLGGSGTTQNGLRVNSDGAIILRQAATNRIVTEAGLVQAGVPFEWRVVNNTTDGLWELYVNDLDNIATNDVGAPAVFARTSTWGSMNQFGRFSTSLVTPVEVRRFYSLGQASFTDEWDATSATGTGSTWTSVGGTRNLTIVNATGPADSWWVGYTSGPTVELGESTLEVVASSAVDLSGFKVGAIAAEVSGAFTINATSSKLGWASPTFTASAAATVTALRRSVSSPSAAASAFFGVNGAKIGASSTVVSAVASASVGTFTIDIRNATFTVSAIGAAQVGAAKHAGTTFAVAASAAASVPGRKNALGIPTVSASIAAAASGSKQSIGSPTATLAGTAIVSGAKVAYSTVQFNTLASFELGGFKVGVGSTELAGFATIDLISYNNSVQLPVSTFEVSTYSFSHVEFSTQTVNEYTVSTLSGVA